MNKMTEQIEQLLLSKQDSNIRLGLTLHFSQGGSIVDFSKWIYACPFYDLFSFKSFHYLIYYIHENFEIRRSDFRFIAKNIKVIRSPENTDISDYLELLVKSTELMKKIKNNLVNNLI